MITSKRAIPINLTVGHECFFQHELIKELPDYHLTEISNALITPDGLALHKLSIAEDSLFALSHKFYFKGIYQLYYLFSGLFASGKKEQMILAFDAWSFGYFHWMTEFIPRLFKAKDLISESTIVLPSINNSIWNKPTARNSIFKNGKKVAGARGYYTESLDAFELENVYYHKPRKVLRVKKLLIPSHLAPSGNYNDEVMREVRSFYFSYYKIEQTVPSKRLFITRSLAARRNIVNEKEVIECVRKLGFEIVAFEELSFPDQVRLLSETVFLIGQHGAGLTNVMFMKPDSYVMELKTGGDSMNHCYFSLANALKIHYLYQFCKGDGASVQDADILVDHELLEANIELVVGRL